MSTLDQTATPSTGHRESRNGSRKRDSSSRSPTNRESGLSSSYGSSRSQSSFSSRKTGGRPRPSHQEAHESSRVLGEGATSTRDYGAMDTTGAIATNPTSTNQDSHSVQQSRRDDSAAHQDHQTGSSDEDGPHPSRLGQFVDHFGSLELDNKGSVARDHLALERTFLAWLRTSLAFASIGIAVTQLFRLNTTSSSAQSSTSGQNALLTSDTLPPQLDASQFHAASAAARLHSVGKPLGSTFIGVAIIVLVIGFHRYFESQYWIIRGKFPASRGSVALTAFVAASLIVAALAVVLAVSPSAVEQ
ncbi:Uncharacterized protein PECH_002824 [Penicillium ucsense]|uniref:DUF202 domain-containing protein n=1 Tax=Penicillium ucsense TaxID=2839758 RepID=A0A8J8W481_9EURO|nr:Uncharacterized protein PECM_005868 [Penicillium ucsense]KAF7730351.1 Uncharacterized protein PECH_002824 [Penicillium ucsense]